MLSIGAQGSISRALPEANNAVSCKFAPPFLCANAAHLWQNQCDSGSYTQPPQFPWRASQLETHHHWNLIGWYPQVRGRRYSAALLDSLALSPICGDVCSSWRHDTTCLSFAVPPPLPLDAQTCTPVVFPCCTKLNIQPSFGILGTYLCYKAGYKFLRKVCMGENTAACVSG